MQSTIVEASQTPVPKMPGRPSAGSKYDPIIEQVINLYDAGAGQHLRVQLDSDDKPSVIHSISNIARNRMNKDRAAGLDVFRLRQVTVETGKVFDIWLDRLPAPVAVKHRAPKTEPAVEAATVAVA